MHYTTYSDNKVADITAPISGAVFSLSALQTDLKPANWNEDLFIVSSIPDDTREEAIKWYTETTGKTPQFKTNYPIKICLFPEIVSDKEPSIRLCTKEEKGRAIVQLIQSTLMQTQDLAESVTVKKMINMIEDYPYYKFNLCHDIEKNTEFLREFMNNLDIKDFRNIGLNKIAVDITFDLANILDTESGVIYSMNKFATNIFENLQNGVSPKDILKYLKQYSNKNINLEKEFNVFIMRLKDKSIYKELDFYHKEPIINDEFVVEDDYKLSMTEYGNNEVNELIKENENELCIK